MKFITKNFIWILIAGLATSSFFIGIKKPNVEPITNSGMVGATTFQVYQGGTGATTFTSNAILKGNTQNAIQASGVSIDGSNNVTGINNLTVSSCTGCSSGGSFTGLLMGEGSTTKTHIDSLTYDAGAFRFSPTASAGTLYLDYTNGPASRSMANTWTALNTFSVGASFSQNIDVVGTSTLGGIGGIYANAIGSGNGTLGFNSGEPVNGVNYAAGVAGAGVLMQYTNSDSTFRIFNESSVAAGAGHGHTTILTINPGSAGATLSVPFEMAGSYASIGGNLFIPNDDSQFIMGSTELNVTIGGTSYPTQLAIHDEASTLNAELELHHHNITATNGATMEFAGSSGGEANETAVVSGDRLAVIGFLGHDGTDYAQSARIDAFVDNTVGNNQVPGQLRFTIANTTGTMTERLRIDSTGLSKFTGNASISGNFEVLGYASISGKFTQNSVASNSFLGSWTGATDNTGSVGTSDNKLKVLWSYIVHAINQFFFPTTTSTVPSTAGEAIVNTASGSLEVYTGSANKILDGKICKTFVIDSPTASNPGFVGPVRFDNPFTLTSVQMIASGSNSAGWNIKYGTPSTFTTSVFTANKSASSSTAPTYTSFANSTLTDGQALEVVITSRSAVLQSFSITTCGRYNH